MRVRLTTNRDVEAWAWKTAKIFVFAVIAVTVINSTLPITRSGGSGAGTRTLVPGVIRTGRTEVISVGFPARVLRTFCQEGDLVKPGDVIAELESPEVLAELESAGRRLQLAQLRASLSSNASSSEYSIEQSAATDRLVDTIRRRLAEYSTSEQEAAYARAATHSKQVAALVERHLATAEELDIARRAEANEMHSLQMARLTASRLKEDLASAIGQQRLVRLGTNRREPETRRRIYAIELEQARRDYDAAKGRVGQLRVAAPIGGVVLSGLAVAQDRFLAGTPIARIADLSRFEVDVRVPASVAKSLVPGTRVEVRLPSDPPHTVTGTVMSSTLAADVRNGGYDLRVGIPSSESHRALVGLEATVDISH
jgi:multidrug efflux pump subunit AcrA (membrane-fusion protein)